MKIKIINNNVVWHNPKVTRKLREQLNGHRALCVWFTGLPSSGKSTIAHGVEEALFNMGIRTYTLDGDNIRHGLCADLGFTPKDRTENLRRITELIKLLLDAGLVVLAAFVSPFEKDREKVKKIIGEEDFLLVYCKCSVEICEKRDSKGMYQKARKGEIKEYTGVSSPYEEPKNPDLVLETDILTVEESVQKILKFVKNKILNQIK